MQNNTVYKVTLVLSFVFLFTVGYLAMATLEQKRDTQQNVLGISTGSRTTNFFWSIFDLTPTKSDDFIPTPVEPYNTIVFLGENLGQNANTDSDSLINKGSYKEVFANAIQKQTGITPKLYDYTTENATIQTLKTQQVPQMIQELTNNESDQYSPYVLFVVNIGLNDVLANKNNPNAQEFMQTLVLDTNNEIDYELSQTLEMINPSVFSGGVDVILTNVYDPTDLANIPQDSSCFATFNGDYYQSAISSINNAYTQLAFLDLTQPDIYSKFFGHGINSRDTWYEECININDAGSYNFVQTTVNALKQI